MNKTSGQTQIQKVKNDTLFWTEGVDHFGTKGLDKSALFNCPESAESCKEGTSRWHGDYKVERADAFA